METWNDNASVEKVCGKPVCSERGESVYTVDDSLNTIEPLVFEVEGWEWEQAWNVDNENTSHMSC